MNVKKQKIIAEILSDIGYNVKVLNTGELYVRLDGATDFKSLELDFQQAADFASNCLEYEKTMEGARK